MYPTEVAKEPTSSNTTYWSRWRRALSRGVAKECVVRTEACVGVVMSSEKNEKSAMICQIGDQLMASVGTILVVFRVPAAASVVEASA